MRNIAVSTLRWIGLITLFSWFGLVQAQDKTKPGELIIEPPTLICLGFEWYIEGDQNRNAMVEVQYRKSGGSEWEQGMPLLRVGGEEAGEPLWNYVTPNLFAGSIIDLEADTEYECQLTLTDPDGSEGQTIRKMKVRTRKEPQIPQGGKVRHVYPENFKGTKEEPAFNGLLHAYYGYQRYADWILTTDPVEPGDIILMHGGEYKADYKDYRDYHGLTFDGTYALTVDGTEDKPIVIQAAGDGEVILDGNGNFKLFDVTAADYNYFDGLTFRNTEVAICAGTMNIIGCDGLTVRNCKFDNIGIGIQGQYEGSRHFYIADNEFYGREDTTRIIKTKKRPDGSNLQEVNSYYAVKVHGQGHTIAYNHVRHFFDGIDVCTHCCPETDPAIKSVAIDIYNNDIFLCTDNFIEADGGTHNIRVLRNRCANSGQQALSNQPVLGGPVYWIRNIVYHVPDATGIKFWGMFPAGILVYHNTFTTFLSRSDKPVSNLHLLNNLILPPSDVKMPVMGLYNFTSYSSLDYNGYKLQEPFIEWWAPEKTMDFNTDHQVQKYETLKAFSKATGQEKHGILVDFDIFENVPEPPFLEYKEANADFGVTYPVYQLTGLDFRLKEKSKPVDAGKIIPNVNEDYAGKAPDLGALERGKPVPHYGPRTAK